MYQSLKLFALLVFVQFALSACQTAIYPDLPKMGNTPTVNAILQVGYPVKVHVSMAAKLDTLPLEAIGNAHVALYVNDTFAEHLNYTGNALYEGETVVEAGKKYLCKVVLPGTDTLSCEDAIPLPQKITNIKHINIAGKDEEGVSYPALQVSFTNNPQTTSYYEISILLQRGHGDVMSAYYLNFVDPVLLNEGLPILLFSNETITDTLYTMHINYKTGAWGGRDGMRATLSPLVIELRTVSYDYYRFRKQHHLYEEGRLADGLITSISPAKMHSNVKNGLGIFAGFSSMFSDTIKPVYER
jgi:hypothetical protein